VVSTSSLLVLKSSAAEKTSAHLHSFTHDPACQAHVASPNKPSERAQHGIAPDANLFTHLGILDPPSSIHHPPSTIQQIPSDTIPGPRSALLPERREKRLKQLAFQRNLPSLLPIENLLFFHLLFLSCLPRDPRLSQFAAPVLL